MTTSVLSWRTLQAKYQGLSTLILGETCTCSLRVIALDYGYEDIKYFFNGTECLVEIINTSRVFDFTSSE